MQFCDLANKAGRLSKTKQASRGLSAMAELLIYINNNNNKKKINTRTEKVQH